MRRIRYWGIMLLSAVLLVGCGAKEALKHISNGSEKDVFKNSIYEK